MAVMPRKKAMHGVGLKVYSYWEAVPYKNAHTTRNDFANSNAAFQKKRKECNKQSS